MDVQHQQEDFAKKKLEREQEIQAIQEMLNNITNSSPQKSKISSSSEKLNENYQKIDNLDKKENKMENPSPQATSPVIKKLQRSNTDMQIRFTPKKTDSTRTSRKDTNRASINSNAKPRSKSSSQLPAPSNATKCLQAPANKKTYNPEEARRFMEIQKKKRRSEAANQPEAKANKEKEEIRKRLEELKKNTRKLVSKNLDKKKQQHTTNHRMETDKHAEKQNTENCSTKDSVKTIEKQYTKNDDKDDKPSTIQGLSLHLQKPSVKAYHTDRLKEINDKKECRNKNLQIKDSKGDHELRTSNNSSASRTPLNIPLGENHKRIGLLRKTEDEKDYSFSALNSLHTLKPLNQGKENKSLEALSSKLNTSLAIKINKENVNQHCGKETTSVVNLESGLEDDISDLEIPSKNLQSNSKKSEDTSVIKKENTTEKNQANDLPFLLRPSAAQVYPYNFIMAVRRKLEAISQPHVAPEVPSKKEKIKTTQYTSTSDLVKEVTTLNLAQEKEVEKKRKLVEGLEQQESKKRKSIEGTNGDKNNKQSTKVNKSTDFGNKGTFSMSLESLKSPETYIKDSINNSETCSKNMNISLKESRESAMDSRLNAKSKYKSMESVASNYSSASLPIPISNTLTEVSSLRTESRHTFVHTSQQSLSKQSQLNTEDEVASISSHVFSSPEKKYAKQYQSDFEFAKPRPVSPLSLEKVENLKIKSKQNKLANDSIISQSTMADEDKEIHFSQLLDDFNRSLSQVIQVNEQLKCTLDKSSRILSPRNATGCKLRSPSTHTTETDKQYSSDFEHSPSSTIPQPLENDKLKMRLESTNEKLKCRKRQLFEMANKVKPLLTSQKSSQESEENETPLPNLDLDINIKLISNSSARTTTSLGPEEEDKESEVHARNSEETEGDIESEVYEKRLHTIEQLKENLKQTILESQQKRRKSTEIIDSHSMKGNTEERFPTSRTSRSNMSLFALVVEQEDGREALKEIKPKPTFQENLNKQQNQQKSNHSDCTDKEDLILKYTKCLQEQNSNKMVTQSSKEFQRKNSTQGDYHSASSQSSHKNHQSQQQRCHSNPHSEKSMNTRSHNSQVTREINSETQSDVESLVLSDEREKLRSQDSKPRIASEETNSSSIEEELQETHETVSQENESPPSKHNQTKASINCNNRSKSSKRDTSAFIKSHINRSRGDFQDIVSKEASLNESQFQLAIRSSLRSSSTELAQSADDEVTASSVKSIIKKPHSSNYSSNPPSYNAVTTKHNYKQLQKTGVTSSNTLTSLSPSKASRRISIGTEIVKFFHQYENERSKSNNNNDTMSESSLNYSNVGLVGFNHDISATIK